MSSRSISPARLELKRDLAVELLRSCGAARLPINGSSMLPSLWPGDILDVRRQNATEIQPGHVVVFQRDSRLVAHRVVRRLDRNGSTLLITRGDRRWKPDAPVFPHQLLGRVEAVERGDRRFQPSLTCWGRLGSFICWSDLGARLVGRLMRSLR